MSANLTQIEKRLRRVESELAELKKIKQPDDSVPGYRKIAGQFDNDPVFDEIIRLGKEIRDREESPKRFRSSKPARRKKA